MELQEHKRLIELLPAHLQGFCEYQAAMSTEQKELDSIFKQADHLLSDMFIDTATLAGIEHREKMYGIVPPVGATLEARRLDVKAKESRTLPYTVSQYREMLAAMCGDENFKIVLEPNAYSLYVKVRAVKQEGKDPLSLLESVDAMTMQVIPANLIYGSTLFDYHEAAHTTYHGAAACMSKHYQVEVV